MARKNASGEPGELVTATLARGASPPRPLGALVRVLGSKATPPSFALTGGKCVIGAGAGCDIVVADATMSRAHLELTLQREGVGVKDLGSHNGTFYLGQRIESMVLALGGHLTLGATKIAIDADVRALDTADVYESDSYRSMVGTAPAMRRLFAALVRLEGSLVTVLVQGESGVGKELVARALHEGSSVASGPLVTVNCGAIPKDLVASELFGHKRGAFTGAVDARKGAFESADGGTLFLDEIGELPLDVQPMLLRALETNEVRSVGSDQAKRVQVRIVAATHRDLGEATREGTFREDLFYRLAVVRLSVPPLRERREDIEPLARLFAEALGLVDLPSLVVDQLKSRPWWGNARELRNAVHAYAALGALPDAGLPRAPELEQALVGIVDTSRPFAEQKDEIYDRFTRVYLKALLEATGGNQTQAARLAQLDRSYLGRLIAKYGLSR